MLPTPEESIQNNQFNIVVSRVLSIEDITWGEPKQKYLVRYRGKLLTDSAIAFDQLSKDLRPLGVTPQFRMEQDSHSITLLSGVFKSSPSNPWINLALFIITLFSVIFAGALYAYQGPISTDNIQMFQLFLSSLITGVPFAVSMLAILLAHEFGHYLAARYHKTNVTLPYFIPFPLSPFGTMGAFIQLKEPPKNKRIMLDIGIAGPLAGLVVAIPVLFIGLSLSQVNKLPLFPATDQGLSLEGNSILYLFIKFVALGKLLPAPISYGGTNPLLYWLGYWLTGQPLPWGGIDVTLHPIAWAGWAGLLVTALNLVPAGQLDGGHLLYVLLGNKARRFIPVILVILLLLGVVWSGWWLWAVLIFVFGRTYAEPLDQITELDPKRRGLAILGIILFFLVFTPVPLTVIIG